MMGLTTRESYQFGSVDESDREANMAMNVPSEEDLEQDTLKLRALHWNSRLDFCGGHFLTLSSDNIGIKIEMKNDQSSAPQLPVSKAFLVVVWLSYLQTRPAHQRYHCPPCLQGPRLKIVLSFIC